MTTHSSILAWKIPRTEEPGRLQSPELKESDTTEHTSILKIQGKNWFWLQDLSDTEFTVWIFNILSTLKRTSKKYIRKNILYKDIYVYMYIYLSIYISSQKHIKQLRLVLYKIR